jgi:hypothetical protein
MLKGVLDLVSVGPAWYDRTCVLGICLTEV